MFNRVADGGGWWRIFFNICHPVTCLIYKCIFAKVARVADTPIPHEDNEYKGYNMVHYII